MGQSASRAVQGIRAGMAARARSWARRLGGIERADEARRAFDWDRALVGYEAYLRWSPRDFGVRMRLIKTLYAAGRLDEAEAEARLASLARPDKVSLALVVSDIASARAASVPLADYQRFRSAIAIPAAPRGRARLEPIVAVVDGRERTASAIHVTLDSLRRSTADLGSIIVWSLDSVPAFSGAAALDDVDDVKAALAGAACVLMLEAGVILEPEGLGWLVHALEETQAAASYGDDDHVVSAQGRDGRWSDPAFYAAPHRLEIETSPRLPAAVLFRGAPSSLLSQGRRQRLLSAIEVGPVAHVPLLLAARTEREDDVAPLTRNPLPSFSDADRARILAVIPTRDEGAVLEQMIDGLVNNAADAGTLDIIVVDNGSRDTKTLTLLESLCRQGRIRVLRVDEPFNWSRLNNLAAADTEAEILLFANNDMKMLTPGWDDRLRHSLSTPGVGVVGARLIYPNGRVQHAGLALGAMRGRPLHEGLGSDPADPGPIERWRRNRPAAAVTGAFMGVRRDVFEAARGFNEEEFAVGCNDIDFCLRSRALGWTVLYAADLELVHWESLSRGHDDTEAKLRRAEAEFTALDRIWGQEAHRDPSRNPHWVNHETLVFHGLRQPSDPQVKEWILESVQAWGRPGRCD